MNESSILSTIKRDLGIDDSDQSFDGEIISSINGAFSKLNQLGVGPKEGFIITGKDESWADFCDSIRDLPMIERFVYFTVRLEFDPPTNSFLVTSIQNQLNELTFRLNMYAEGAFDGV